MSSRAPRRPAGTRPKAVGAARRTCQRPNQHQVRRQRPTRQSTGPIGRNVGTGQAGRRAFGSTPVGQPREDRSAALGDRSGQARAEPVGKLRRVEHGPDDGASSDPRASSARPGAARSLECVSARTSARRYWPTKGSEVDRGQCLSASRALDLQWRIRGGTAPALDVPSELCHPIRLVGWELEAHLERH